MLPISSMVRLGGGMALVVGGLLLLLAGRPRTTVVALGISKAGEASDRTLAAVKVATTESAYRIITTGKGAGIGGKTEADWMMALAKQHTSLPVYAETASNSTMDNVKNVAPLIPKGERVILVSTQNHVKSAAWCMRYRYGKDAYYVCTSESLAVQIPAQSPTNCDRVGCC